jgi:hypothetical protein
MRVFQLEEESLLRREGVCYKEMMVSNRESVMLKLIYNTDHSHINCNVLNMTKDCQYICDEVTLAAVCRDSFSCDRNRAQ